MICIKIKKNVIYSEKIVPMGKYILSSKGESKQIVLEFGERLLYHKLLWSTFHTLPCLLPSSTHWLADRILLFFPYSSGQLKLRGWEPGMSGKQNQTHTDPRASFISPIVTLPLHPSPPPTPKTSDGHFLFWNILFWSLVFLRLEIYKLKSLLENKSPEFKARASIS